MNIPDYSFIFGDFLNAGQCLPVDWYTTILGSCLDLTLNILQALGKSGSQVTLK
ncbi:MAG: hypothetical protein JW874_15040 [Spirochaetales bacterium]|nr:hypothetical protein [Spirochaetales bacterium]